jgi:hypothetical protein
VNQTSGSFYNPTGANQQFKPMSQQQQQQSGGVNMFGGNQSTGMNLFPQGNQIGPGSGQQRTNNMGGGNNTNNNDFDFFQNARPVQTNLKINKINSFQSNDLI